MNQEEIWKDIKGYEGLYQVSSFGRVRSLDRVITSKKGVEMFFKGCILKSRIGNVGYLELGLRENSKMDSRRIHRLLAEHFVPNPDNKPCVNHKNGIKTDNRIENIEWCTYSDNNKHAYKTGLKTPSSLGKFGSDNHFSIPVVKLDNELNLLSEYGGLLESERETGISSKNIGAVCRGKRKKAGGYKWMYKKDYYGTKNNR